MNEKLSHEKNHLQKYSKNFLPDPSESIASVPPQVEEWAVQQQVCSREQPTHCLEPEQWCSVQAYLNAKFGELVNHHHTYTKDENNNVTN